jgi:hypothetical protein
MRGKNVACSLGALHYIAAIIILLDSIIFMCGFSPFFITQLAPAAYYFFITYCITVGSLLFCQPKLASLWNKNVMETIISIRQLRTYRRKRRFNQSPNSKLTTKDAQLEKIEQ